MNGNGGWETLRHRYGDFSACLLNVSNNNCSGISGILCYYCQSAYIYHSSFINNICISYYICIEFGNSINELRSSNVINNSQKELSLYGTITSLYNLTVIDSSILNNSADYDFFCDDSRYTITVIDCVIDNNSFGGNVETTNCTSNGGTVSVEMGEAEHCVLVSVDNKCTQRTPYKCKCFRHPFFVNHI